MEAGGLTMTLFRFTNTVDGDEDPIFIWAISEADALMVFGNEIGAMPRSMLKIEPIEELPEGAEAIN